MQEKHFEGNLEDDINETLHQPVPWILKNFIFYKFYPIKRIYLSEKIPYLVGKDI